MKKKQIWIIVVIVLVLAFIWGQSMLPVKNSGNESRWLLKQVINPALKALGLRPMTHNTLRKCAHVFEYTVLALAASFVWRGKIVGLMGAGMFVALCDETVQIFSRRGSLVKDIWIDMIGIALGSLLGWLLTRKKRRPRKSA
ncbi:MAG: VanZ family protein [Mailhella sp.]|nr:VanZ family protein [Mailhella sp.]